VPAGRPRSVLYSFSATAAGPSGLAPQLEGRGEAAGAQARPVLLAFGVFAGRIK